MKITVQAIKINTKNFKEEDSKNNNNNNSNNIYINNNLMEDVGEKIIFNLDLNELILKNNLHKENFINIRDDKIHFFNYDTNELEKNLNHNYENLISKISTQKEFYDKEDLKELNDIENIKSVIYSSIIYPCKDEDFEEFKLTDDCILGRKSSYLVKKGTSICVMKNFVLKQKKKKFLDKFINSLFLLDLTQLSDPNLNINLIKKNNENLNENENENFSNRQKLHYLNKNKEKIFSELENYYPEVYSTEEIFTKNTHLCKCVPKIDYECDANFDYNFNTNNGIKFSKENILDLMKLNKENNTTIDNCKNYIERLDDKTNINNNNADNNNKDYKIYISSANICLLDDKHLYLFNTNFEEWNKNSLNIEGKVNELNTEDKKNSGRSLGIMVTVFLIVIFVLMIYMGVLVFQRLFVNFFKDKNKRENEDEDIVTLKSNKIIKRNKELDNLY
jgi:hypothetical protein